MPTFMGHHSALKEKLKFCQTAKTSDLILQRVKISLLVGGGTVITKWGEGLLRTVSGVSL